MLGPRRSVALGFVDTSGRLVRLVISGIAHPGFVGVFYQLIDGEALPAGFDDCVQHILFDRGRRAVRAAVLQSQRLWPGLDEADAEEDDDLEWEAPEDE